MARSKSKARSDIKMFGYIDRRISYESRRTR